MTQSPSEFVKMTERGFCTNDTPVVTPSSSVSGWSPGAPSLSVAPPQPAARATTAEKNSRADQRGNERAMDLLWGGRARRDDRARRYARGVLTLPTADRRRPEARIRS